MKGNGVQHDQSRPSRAALMHRPHDNHLWSQRYLYMNAPLYRGITWCQECDICKHNIGRATPQHCHTDNCAVMHPQLLLQDLSVQFMDMTGPPK